MASFVESASSKNEYFTRLELDDEDGIYAYIKIYLFVFNFIILNFPNKFVVGIIFFSNLESMIFSEYQLGSYSSIRSLFEHII